jgi:hypothetical protein
LSTLDIPESQQGEVMLKISDLSMDAVKEIFTQLESELVDIRQD